MRKIAHQPSKNSSQVIQQGDVSGQGRASLEAAPEVVMRLLIDKVFSDRQLDLADALIAEDMVEHQNYGPNHAAGPQGVKSVVTSLRRACSDFRLTIEDLAVVDNLVWTRNVFTGTNDGSYMGHPPTHRAIRVDVFDVVRIVGGKIVEHWGVPDRLGFLKQAGLI